jgi:hypothetical protein
MSVQSGRHSAPGHTWRPFTIVVYKSNIENPKSVVGTNVLLSMSLDK